MIYFLTGYRGGNMSPLAPTASAEDFPDILLFSYRLTCLWLSPPTVCLSVNNLSDSNHPVKIVHDYEYGPNPERTTP